MIGVIVYGPECSGTHYLEALLQATTIDPTDHIVRRSLPEWKDYVALPELLAELDRNDIRVLISTRRADVLAQSQVSKEWAKDTAEALIQAQRAYTWAITQCQSLAVPFLMTSYEALADPDYRSFITTWAWDTPDIKAARDHDYIDGNAKYLER